MSETEEKFENVLDKIKQMSKIDIAKSVASMAVHHCVAAVVVLAVKNVAPATTKKEKIQLYIAARVVSGMVADKASERIERKLDKLEAFVKAMIKEAKSDETSTDVPSEPVQEEPAE